MKLRASSNGRDFLFVKKGGKIMEEDLYQPKLKDFFVDDDCPFCRAIQAGETSWWRLRAAWQAARAQQERRA
jgi:hypothetical protein